MHVYAQFHGTLRRNGVFEGVGYSGHGSGKNDPDSQAIRDVGPIPRGMWLIEGPPTDGPHGPYVLRLTPCDGTDVFGRGGFLMHGDMIDPRLAGQASLGCVIMPRGVRELIWGTNDRDLEVIAFDPYLPLP